MCRSLEAVLSWAKHEHLGGQIWGFWSQPHCKPHLRLQKRPLGPSQPPLELRDPGSEAASSLPGPQRHLAIMLCRRTAQGAWPRAGRDGRAWDGAPPPRPKAAHVVVKSQGPAPDCLVLISFPLLLPTCKIGTFPVARFLCL